MLQTKFIKKISNNLTKLKKEATDSREWKYLVNSKTRSKQQIEKLFELYGTLSTHFLFEKGEDVFKNMMPEQVTI